MAGLVMPWMLSLKTLRCLLAPPFPSPFPPFPRPVGVGRREGGRGGSDWVSPGKGRTERQQQQTLQAPPTKPSATLMEGYATHRAALVTLKRRYGLAEGEESGGGQRIRSATRGYVPDMISKVVENKSEQRGRRRKKVGAKICHAFCPVTF